MLPHAREDGLVVQELPDETVVYDLKRHRAHCLNQTAALVWRHCDGQTTVAEIALLMQSELKIPVDEEMVWLAMNQLGRAHLLRERMGPPVHAMPYSRRELIRKLARIGGISVLLPVVTSIIAPTAVQAAATCTANCLATDCTPCNPPGCNKVCLSGKCVKKQGSGCP
ncbi:MAG: PqqD family protein [Candidatus Tectomicrobia bacterium]|nr:PqqD family protein [Candidatus Tectomicrobia bacterium]